MPDSSVEDVLAGRSEVVRNLALQTRALVLDTLPVGILETVEGSDIGYGWTRGYKGLLCVINLHERWVNLGFPYGVDLPDPQDLLRGTGRRHRHVRIAAPVELQRVGLRDLLRAAGSRLPK